MCRARPCNSRRNNRIEVPIAPLDILAQQIVAASASQTWMEDELFALCRRAYPYRELTRADFDQVVRMLADGIATNRGRGHAYLFHDRINHRLKGRRGARLAAITSGGAIPDTANYAVVAEPDGTVVGTVDEDFAVESLAGDIMLLGNTSWRIRGIESGKVRVEDAQGAPPNIPFWRGEAPSRTAELSAEVSSLREEIADRLSISAISHQPSAISSESLPITHHASLITWLKQECAVDQRGAEQIAAYVAASMAVLGTVPTHRRIIAERFFDEGGGMQLVLHAPFGGRINRAWGLALRKRFCVTFDFELQAAATDNGIVISLGEKHSFPLDSVFGYLHSNTVREVLIQAVLLAPMFATRWRWNASRSLALLRFSNGKKVPPQIQRMRSEDLLAAVFPDARACQENLTGARAARQIPDHPLVRETLRDCLTEAMDIDGLTAILRAVENKQIECIAVDTPVPSPFSHEILNANPYAYLDDAPLEERRARAVEMRRTLPPELQGQVGALDPAAIEEVEREAWPVVRDADELHDALLTLVWVPESAPAEWAHYWPTLVEAGRAVSLQARGQGREARGLVATENQTRVERAFAQGDDATFDAIVQGWMESIGPTTAAQLAARLQLSSDHVNAAMLRLEAQGQVLRGQFRPIGQARGEGFEDLSPGAEWCHRRLLARIHRLTIATLRKEVEPVSAAEFMSFLLRWQHVAPGARLHGEAGLAEVIGQLAGFEAAASAWEPHLLRARLAKYEPEWLDRLCLSGAVTWGRLSTPVRVGVAGEESARRLVPTSTAPVSVFPREAAEWLVPVSDGMIPAWLSGVAQRVLECLQRRGASFFSDIARETGHLAAEVEQGLWELVAAGLVTADWFDNMRALFEPRRRRAEGRERMRGPRHAGGRWSLLRPAISYQPSAISSELAASAASLVTHHSSLGSDASRITHHSSRSIEPFARQLLRRYGVVFRDVLGRESPSIAWRDLLVQYRRMELQGDVRGGRFVSGFVGEQFALPEALESLRALRKTGFALPQEVKLSAVDPLNLAGVILPGPRIPAVSTNFLVIKDGAIVRTVMGRAREVRELGLAKARSV
jgi:ATP-dependent helicase Lhr and Lhr-like helicase